MNRFTLNTLAASRPPVELIERKGIGHPDTICDALAETFSRALSRYYREHFGTVLHHNVDKALLVGGRASPKFGGGTVEEKIDIYLTGRAVSDVSGKHVPVDDIAHECANSWLSETFHALEPIRHVRIHPLVRRGSGELVGLFERGSTKIPLCNDTSIGVGYAPLSPLETLVRTLQEELWGSKSYDPAWGEDMKIMGWRQGDQIRLTVACAMIDRYIQDLPAYLDQKKSLEATISDIAASKGIDCASITVNAADNPDRGDIYLTVTGTSAESGDDGQVGRGNRINGLITPCRPMSLEAAAGKNPVSHIGKLYNVTAGMIARALISEIDTILYAECILLGQIGSPVTAPAMIDIRIATKDGSPADDHRSKITEITKEHLNRIPRLVDRFLEGSIDVF